MLWQDAAIAVLNIVFVISLVPMLREPEKPPILTSVPTGLALLGGAATVLTLGRWVTAVMQGLMRLGWLALAWQRSAR